MPSHLMEHYGYHGPMLTFILIDRHLLRAGEIVPVTLDTLEWIGYEVTVSQVQACVKNSNPDTPGIFPLQGSRLDDCLIYLIDSV